jgi:predicted DNA-binding mobile mystery protein A
MPRMRRTPEFLALQRQQLDAKLRVVPRTAVPRGGWIRTIRSALGMSAAQLGKRLGLTQQAVAKIERRERAGSITISRLAAVAEALNCDLSVVFRPKLSFEETVRAQATAKARAERDRILHTMRLEAQEQGVDDVLEKASAPDTWITSRLSQLWD